MGDEEFEEMVERLMKKDYSVGTEAFRDKLLQQCLDVLCEEDDAMLIEDQDLELLAAAGSPFLTPSEGSNSNS